MRFKITDSITQAEPKIYTYTEITEAEEKFEGLVETIVEKRIVLIKGDYGYTTEDGKGLARSWKVSPVMPRGIRDDFITSNVCELCGDAISEPFGFCAKCKQCI